MTSPENTDPAQDTSTETIEALTKRAPYAAEVIAAFGALAVEQAACKAALAPDEPLNVQCDPEQFSQGLPLLAGVNLTGLQESHHQAAQCLLPEMIRLFPSIDSDLNFLDKRLAEAPHVLNMLMDALLTENSPILDSLAADLDVSREVLVFAGREILKPCLSRLAETLAPLIIEMPWSKGCCPICGDQPSLAFLRPKDPEPSEFLVSKSGQFWLHCSLCAHNWRYVRSKCPHCETTDHEKLEYFHVQGREDERIYACSSCKRYIPCVDLTSRAAPVDLNMEPLALLHLDHLAREKGFTPLAQTPWNQ